VVRLGQHLNRNLSQVLLLHEVSVQFLLAVEQPLQLLPHDRPLSDGLLALSLLPQDVDHLWNGVEHVVIHQFDSRCVARLLKSPLQLNNLVLEGFDDVVFLDDLFFELEVPVEEIVVLLLVKGVIELVHLAKDQVQILYLV